MFLTGLIFQIAGKRYGDHWNQYFDMDQVITDILLLKKKTIAVEVGLFLEGHKDSFMVEESAG